MARTTSRRGAAAIPHPDNEYWILDREQLRCLASPQRTDMLDRLMVAGPMSVRELAAGIGMKPSALYRHMTRLVDVGLVVEAGMRAGHRRPEMLYATPAPRMRLVHALSEPRLRSLLVQLVATLGRQMTRDFAHGVARDDAATLGSHRNLGVVRVLGSPGPAKLAAINQRLEEITELMLGEGDAEAPFIAFTWTLTPVRSKRHPGEKRQRRPARASRRT